MKKIKKIILAVIVSLIALISVFSCFKGKYTPEPILTPVSVLKPAKSVNDNFIEPTGTYEKLYFNTSLTIEQVINILDKLGLTDDNNTYCGLYYDYDDGSGDAMFIVMHVADHYIIGSSNGVVFSTSLEENLGVTKVGWQDFNNPVLIEPGTPNTTQIPGTGVQNELLKDLISPVPFLFEGTSNSIAWTSSGLDNPNDIQNIYFNTNLTNQAIKNILDTYVGDTSGIDIFYYLDAGVRVRCHVINNSANAFIQIIGGSTIFYKWIYDPIDTDEVVWWYGIDPAIIDNGNVIISPRGNSLNGFNIYELKALFSSANDFTETPSGDSYEQGYRDGYTAGETAGYNSGYTEGQTAGYNSGYTAGETAGYNSGYTAGESAGQTAGYNNGYTAGQTAGYNQGYLDGLDDGAGSNVNFQYIESVLTLIGNFLNIEILPNIKLSYALGIIIILSIISIIKMVVK